MLQLLRLLLSFSLHACPRVLCVVCAACVDTRRPSVATPSRSTRRTSSLFLLAGIDAETKEYCATLIHPRISIAIIAAVSSSSSWRSDGRPGESIGIAMQALAYFLFILGYVSFAAASNEYPLVMLGSSLNVGHSLQLTHH